MLIDRKKNYIKPKKWISNSKSLWVYTLMKIHIRLLFAVFGIFLSGNRAGSQVKGEESKFDKYLFIYMIPGQLPVKKILIQIFSSFAAIDQKGHFRKILTRIFKFGSFYWYLHFLKTIIKLPDAEFNAELIDTDFKSQKWKTKKFVCPFLIALFYFKTNLIK